tara:strand:+ start:265 stop:576 length:312 start_codon:yes stop_codon:yes gene_type:complete
MIVKMVEIYQDSGVSNYTENTSPRKNYSLREVYVNTSQIVSFREDPLTATKMKNGLLQLELNPMQEFTKLLLADGNMSRSMIVVGSPSVVADKLNKGKQLLRG